MQKTRIALFLIAIFFFLMITPLWAMQPEITWIENPSEEYTVYYYGYDPFSDLRYQPAKYGKGLYAVNVLEGELDYTALSPDGCGTFYQGYVDQQGQWVIPPIYDWGTAFQDGYALVMQTMEEKRNGGISSWTTDRIIDINRNVIAAFDVLNQQGYHLFAMQDGYVRLSRRDNLQEPVHYGLATITGQLILPADFLTVHFPQNGLCLVQTEDGYGFWNTAGIETIPPQYEAAQDFSEGLAAIQQNGKWGFIDTTGKLVIAPVYDEVQPFCEGLAAVKMDALWGFIDTSGQLTIPVQYTMVQSFSEGVAAVQQNSKWGCIDQHGNTILPCQYQAVETCSDNRMAVKWQNRYGYFDTSGEKIIDFLYGAATDFHEGFAAVSSGDFSNCQWNSYWHIGIGSAVYNNNRFGVIDRWGHQVLPEEYLCISDFTDGTAICQRACDKKVGIIQAPEVSAVDPGKRSFIRLYCNNQLLPADQSPILVNSRTLVPLRIIAETFGADVAWDSQTQTSTIRQNARIITLSADEPTAEINGQQTALDAPAQILNGRTMVPLRFIAQQFGAQIQWDDASYSVYLSTESDV